MRSAPTQRQLECLRAIDAYITANGFPPSLRDLARAIGKRSSNGTWLLVSYLERLGLVKVGKSQARSIRITPAGRAHLDHPFDYRAEARIEEMGL